LILADTAQATLLVVSANNTHKGAVEAGLKRLQHSRANVLGTVLTMHEMNKAGYGYDYNYNYNYDYGSGSDEDEDESDWKSGQVNT